MALKTICQIIVRRLLTKVARYLILLCLIGVYTLYYSSIIKNQILQVEAKLNTNFSKFLAIEAEIINYYSNKIIPLALQNNYTNISNTIRNLESISYVFSSLSSYIPVKVNWLYYKLPSIVINSYSTLDYNGLAPIDSYYIRCMNPLRDVEISKAYASPEFLGRRVFHIGKGFFNEDEKYLGQLDLVFPLATLKKELAVNLEDNSIIFAIVNDAKELIVSNHNLQKDTFILKNYTPKEATYEIIIGIKWKTYLYILIKRIFLISAAFILASLIIDYIKKFKKLKQENLNYLRNIEINQTAERVTHTYAKELSHRLFDKIHEIRERNNVLLNSLKNEVDIKICLSQQISLMASIKEAILDLESMNVTLNKTQAVNIENILQSALQINLPQSQAKNILVQIENKVNIIVNLDEVSLLQLISSIIGQMILELPHNSTIKITTYISSFQEAAYLYCVFQDNGFKFLTQKQYQENFFSFKVVGWQAIFKIIQKLGGTVEIKHMPHQGNNLVLGFRVVSD